MKVLKYQDVTPVHMHNDIAKNIDARVMLGKQDGADNFCMRVFEIAKDGHTPKHTHDWEHEIFVHKGTGQVLIDETWHCLEPGTAIFVPANIEHQLKNTADDPFVFVCLVPSKAPEL